MASAFREALDGLLTRVGLFDVILPFLLVFAIVFAALEKSRVFGVNKMEGGVEITKKNLNAIVALSIAFFVVASSRLVELITKFSSNATMIILFSVVFLMSAGLFFKEGELFEFFSANKNGPFFVWTIFALLIIIFLAAIGWLNPVVKYIGSHWQESYVSGIILFVIILAALFFITWTPNPYKKKEEKK